MASGRKPDVKMRTRPLCEGGGKRVPEEAPPKKLGHYIWKGEEVAEQRYYL